MRRHTRGYSTQGLTDQGFEPWPNEGSTGASDSIESGTIWACAYEPVLEHEVRGRLKIVFKASGVVQSRDPIEG